MEIISKNQLLKPIKIYSKIDFKVSTVTPFTFSFRYRSLVPKVEKVRKSYFKSGPI